MRLLVGFDSAWTPRNKGAIVAVIHGCNGVQSSLGAPQLVNFVDAVDLIRTWQREIEPESTLILLDQPTVVANALRQRPVEQIVCSSVSARRGGMQPASTSRTEMFGQEAPIWSFLREFGGVADPMLAVPHGPAVLETYPVLAMIALGWVRKDERARGRLLKYNPQRRRTFVHADWQFLCEQVASSFRTEQLNELAGWPDTARSLARPRKSDQDKLDACLCLLVALHLADGYPGLMVGDVPSGYIVVPHSASLQEELSERCRVIDRRPSEWVRKINYGGVAGSGSPAAGTG